MPSVLSAKEMQDLENEAFQSGRVSSRTLMERAGQGVTAALLERLPSSIKRDSKALVLCGPGNNGGDGFVIARLLVEKGWQVDVLFWGTYENLSDDAGHMFDLWKHSNEKSLHILGKPDLTSRDIELITSLMKSDKPLLIVDALFGIGLDRPIVALRPVFDLYMDRQSRTGKQTTYCVAVDVPSGLSDDGPLSDNPICVMQADLTVTFHRLKEAHIAAPRYCGETVVLDIGL